MDLQCYRQAVSAAFGGTWAVVAARDNVVLRSRDFLVKVARFPDGRSRLEAGVLGAVSAARIGAPAVQPTRIELIDTHAGPASLWPWVDHLDTTAANLGGARAAQLGEALQLLQLVALPVPNRWDPFARIPHRLAASTFDKVTLDRVRRLLSVVQVEIPTIDDWRFAHGDASTRNMLDTGNSCLLIDFDSCGGRPEGWDLACLFVDLVLEAGRPDVFSSVLQGWKAASSFPSRWEVWALVKATMATTFILTQPVTKERRDIIGARCVQIERWVKTRAWPAPLMGV